MSELVKIVDSLENKLSKLLHKLELLQQANQKLETELVSARNDKDETIKTVSEWEQKYNSLKLANSMLGSSNSKRETNLKINNLIKDIDDCIARLSN